MLKKNLQTISFAVTILLVLSLVPAGANPARARSAQSDDPASGIDAHPLAASPSGNFVIEGTEDGATCRDATPEEAKALAGRDLIESLHVISPVREDGLGEQDAGLKIILRGTPQLETFPQAKNAFLRAAQTWEAVIRNPITLIIDVDYGPTRFGVPYPDPNLLGSTFAQPIGSNTFYPTLRSRLIAQASSPKESALYNALPVGTVATDLGTTAAVEAPSAIFRALGLIAPVADPASETATLGPPPSIGFNSAFQFDFDPGDGITPGAVDFDAVAVHEMGHALGFISNAGSLELDPRDRLSLSVLDLLRFRPGVTSATFPSALRIQSSGGAQVFFAGGQELALSTGRPDASGGDGRQASHWKDDELTGQYIGIMDPTLSRGQRKTITDNDLLALDAMGYEVSASEDETIALTPGVARPGSIAAPSPGSALLGETQYSVQAPAGASQLTIDLSGNQDVDLYVRFGQRIAVASSQPVADHVSNSPTGVETIAITPSSSPPLRAGTYYIAIVNFGPGAASFNVKAAVTTGGGSGGGNSVPAINRLRAELKGDELMLTGAAADPDGDMTQAQVNLLDGAGQVVGHTQPFAVSFGSATAVDFTLKVSNLSAFPAAVVASLTLIDRRDNHSVAQTADFSGGDIGGPTLSSASYNGSKLVIKGAGFAGQVLIEINGRVVSISPSPDARKLKIKGSPDHFNLRAGPNRLQVLNGDLRSNLFVLTF
ncbi:MAG TPA: NF038122 family metalloprotease [Blastocatellia bacterium]|nr:NF038122 family metalloprotease [Blastocatellia bacterium]